MFAVVHDGSARLFRVGALASAGIKQSAELGMVGRLVGDAQRAMSSGTVWGYHEGPVLAAPGERVFVVTAPVGSPAFLGLTTMVAPSSNWFTGVDGIDLDRVGTDRETVWRLPAMSAGTDSGTQFQTFPKHPLSRPVPISVLGGGEVLFPTRWVVPVAYLAVQRLP